MNEDKPQFLNSARPSTARATLMALLAPHEQVQVKTVAESNSAHPAQSSQWLKQLLGN